MIIKRKEKNLYLFLMNLSIGVFVLTFILCSPNNSFLWKNEPLHKVVELIGILVAFSVIIVLSLHKRTKNSQKFFFIILSFLCMSILDGFLITVLPVNQFIFLHTISAFFGSIFFSFVCLLPIVFKKFFSHRVKALFWVAAIFFILLGIFVLIFPKTLPFLMLNRKIFILINYCTGLFFFIGSYYFFKNYHKCRKAESLLFFYVGLFLGLASIIFAYSITWDGRWWAWHLLHLNAYLMAFGVVFTRYLKTNKNFELAMRKLKENKEQKSILLNNSPDMISQVDKNLRILWANKAALEKNSLAVGQTCYEAFVNKEEPCEGCPCIKSIESKQIEKGTMYQPFVKGVQGESYWENIGVPLKNKNGDVIGTIEIIRNITDRKKAEEALYQSNEKFRTLVEASPDWIWEVDKNGFYTYASPKIKEILGYESKEVL